MQEHYPGWGITKPLDSIFQEIAASWMERAAK
jgi:hypothetical protein